MIYLSPPHMTGEELNYVRDAIESNWVAPTGPHVVGFENELAGVLKVTDVVAVNSGTSAIHLGLLALGVSPGDEVLCPTLTFCATANPIVYCGARPVFVDSESETWNIDPVTLGAAIEDRLRITGRMPKAIIVVHLFGMPAKMDQIRSIAFQYGIPILEDAAESLGSTINGMATGSLGEVGVLSFNGNKIITTSGGGALLTNNSTIADRARFLRQESKLPLPYYEHTEIGYNYRLSNICAAIGRAQLPSLDARVERRRKNFEIYKNVLEDEGISFQPEPEGSRSNRWLTVICLRPHADITPIDVKTFLEEQGIESRLAWKPMHMQPVFKNAPYYGTDVAETLFQTGLCLPSGSALTDEAVKRIGIAVRVYLKSGR